MKNVTQSTTGTISSQMTLAHCGDYAGMFQDAAYDIIWSLCDLPSCDEEPDQWADIMYDRQGNVFAIWADGELSSQDSQCFYVELALDDCPEAFEGMEWNLRTNE